MKTKRALISMIVATTVFCLSIILNIQIPLASGKRVRSEEEKAVTAESDEIVDEAQNSAIQSFSINEDQTDTFGIEEYQASIDIQVNRTENGQGNSLEISDNNSISNSNTDSLAVNANDDGSESKETVEIDQPKALYSNIGISVAKDYVNIRKEPTTEGSVLGKLYRDSAATILKSEGDWYYVESGSVTGYVKSEFMKTGLSDEELINNYSTLSISVAVDGLNVREGKSTDSKKLTVVYQNERYPVIEIDGDWILVKIEDDNTKGYVKKEFVEMIVAFKDAVSKEEEEKIEQLKAEARAKEETTVKHRESVNYTGDDLKLLACLIHSEAGTQSYEGKLAVANVVLNRVKSSRYPSTIKAVIYQAGQFSVAKSGSLQKQLNNYGNYSSKSQLMSIKAAKAALDGDNNIGGRMYFHTYSSAAKKGYTSYADSVKIQDHLFCLIDLLS